MQELVTSYLLINKKCPLPMVGSLVVTDGNAVSHFGEMKIAAPVPHIQLNINEIAATDFVNYIASQKNIAYNEAKQNLDAFCNRIKTLKPNDEFPVQSIGKFYVDGSGKLQFKNVQLSPAFLPITNAQRVIHPNSSHEMLVGDTQTTSFAMTEFYTESDKRLPSRWWIWAIILFAIAALVFVIYLNDKNSNQLFGIAQSYQLG
jgi:hypothetical protein